MKKFRFQSLLLLAIGGSIGWYGCKKDDSEPAKTAPSGVTTTEITSITQTSASSGGSIGATGGADITARGICFDTVTAPTTDDRKTSDGSGAGSFTSVLTGLTAGKTYFVRSYATNAVGTTYGNEVSFSTLAAIGAPTVVTGAVSDITVSGAKCAGSITGNGGAGQTITEKGIQYSTTAAILESDAKLGGSGPESGFTATLTGLNPSTEYFYRAYAKNTDGKTGYGSVQSFTTSGNPVATLSTGTVSNVGLFKNSALYEAFVSANLTNLNGGVFVKKGFVWSTTNPNPTITSKDGMREDAVSIPSGTFSLAIVDAPRLKTIYVRAFVTTSFSGTEVTGYGSAVSFNTFIEDAEGNKYNFVKSGGRIWMKENLRTKKFRNNTSINEYSSAANWMGASTGQLPGWCYAEAGASTESWAGLLYNGYAVKDPAGLCPAGWHVSTKDDWNALNAAYFGSNSSGEAIKENSSLWSINSGTNASGLSGLPAGQRTFDTGTYQYTGGRAYWWTTEVIDNQTYERSFVKRDDNTFNTDWGRQGIGSSVRCVKD